MWYVTVACDGCSLLSSLQQQKRDLAAADDALLSQKKELEAAHKKAVFDLKQDFHAQQQEEEVSNVCLVLVIIQANLMAVQP